MIRYGIHLWYDNLTVQLKTKLTQFIQIAMKIMGIKEHSYLQTLYEKSLLREAYKILKGSYDAISSVLSLWSVTSCLCIDKIPEVAKTKVSKPKRYSLSKLPPLKRLIQTCPTCLRHDVGRFS